jgi:hydroxymethylpyrimidine pyrophosphatase-like HAD family hydrolase
MNPNRKSTIFIDLDGTLVIHNYQPSTIPDVILPGIVSKLLTWQNEGFNLVLTTGRQAKDCDLILQQFQDSGITFCYCLFNLGAGKRYLINDKKDNTLKAISINIDRNLGIQDVILT